jgi:hypothetical protein
MLYHLLSTEFGQKERGRSSLLASRPLSSPRGEAPLSIYLAINLFVPDEHGFDLKLQPAGLALSPARSFAVVHVIAVALRADYDVTFVILFAFFHSDFSLLVLSALATET